MEFNRDLYQRFLIQKTAQQTGIADFDFLNRKRLLKQLLKALKKNKNELVKALDKDFSHRSEFETKLFEILPVMQSIRSTLHHLRTWMKPIKQRSNVWFRHLKTQALPQPLGVVGIVVPWNYPLQLSLMPLVGALAAGNHVILKMSEYTPNTNQLLKQILGEIFSMQQLQIVTGNQKITQDFTQLPFDRLIFSGTSSKAYEFSSRHLEYLPKTLQTEHKSPAIITKDYSLKVAIKRIFAGKFINAGQASEAPDYAMIPAGIEKSFIEQAKKTFQKIYPNFEHNKDYTHLINKKAFERLEKLIQDAKAKGAKIVPLIDVANVKKVNKLTPCLIFDTTSKMRIMQEEIFGPILPIIVYEDVIEAINYINEHASPLALYLFDKDALRIRKMLLKTTSNVVTINDVLHHASEKINLSNLIARGDMNHFYGKAGFDVFTHYKEIYFQTQQQIFSFLRPPFKKLSRAWTKLVLK